MQKVRDVGDILCATEDYKAAEPALQEALSIVQLCPEQQSQFEKAFIDGVNPYILDSRLTCRLVGLNPWACRAKYESNILARCIT